MWKWLSQTNYDNKNKNVPICTKILSDQDKLGELKLHKHLNGQVLVIKDGVTSYINGNKFGTFCVIT